MNDLNTTFLMAVIFGSFLVTFPVRFIPLAFVNRVGVHPLLKRWLGYVPVSVFSALLVQIVYKPNATMAHLASMWPLMLSIFFSVAIAVKTKSMGLAVAVGFGIYLLGYFIFIYL